MKLNIAFVEAAERCKQVSRGEICAFMTVGIHSEVRLQEREEVVYDVAQDDDIEVIYVINNSETFVILTK